MFGPIRAVAIDDEPGHLLAITTGLSACGIPCMGYWYDRDTSELRPTPPEGGLPFLRLVFMDLNLAVLGGVPETANLCAVVMHVLKQLISKDGGPYLLVFWTQVSGKVPEVERMLYQRLEDIEGIHCPIAVVELPKGQFIGKEPQNRDFKSALQEFYSELHDKIAGLEKAVKEAVARSAPLSAVSSWEARASNASARAVNEVFACAKGDTPDPLKRAEAIERVLAKIAVAASGESSAKDAPARALDAGLVDILVDQFGASVEDLEYRNIIKEAIGRAIDGKTAFQNEVGVSAALNTFFHIDMEVSSAKAGDRGVVISAKPFDTNTLGFRPVDQLTDFLIPYEVFPEERRIEMKALGEAFRKSAEFVLVELGADCDHAQDTARTRRYLLAVEIPVRFFELVRFPFNNKLRNEALQLLGPWVIEGKTLFLLVSCRRFWVWQKKEPHNQGKVKYRLRASLVSKLLHHYSSWHSRPGIVEFSANVNAGTFLYFAYGSNMLTERLKSRAPSALLVGNGILEGHRVDFDKVSTDGSGKCNLKPTGNSADQVHGVLFSVDSSERQNLDRAEGLGAGYRIETVQVVAGTRKCTAVTYVAEVTDSELRPYDWYLELVVAGAVEHRLPGAYVESLQAVGTQPDHDDARRTRNRAALGLQRSGTREDK